MERIPDEVLEFILSFLPPYDDLQKCILVSKRWSQCAQNVLNKTSVNLYRAIIDFDIVWDSITPLDLANTIAKRYSHSTVVNNSSMYVFGGCTCTSTTFNDLWKFNLSTRQFERLLTTGTYPSPKACASMVFYNDRLILYGGWAHPSPYPLHQSWKLFDELHIYSINQNRWYKQVALYEVPPPMAGHSATIHRNKMIIFGGLQKSCDSFDSQFSSSSDIWCLDLDTFLWYKQPTSTEKPLPRYGQSQIYLDSDHLLIIGGCGGSNLIYSDCWLLKMIPDTVWKWRKVKIFNTSNGPGNIWCNQACKVGDKLVVLSQGKVSGTPLSLSRKWNLPNQIRRSLPYRINASAANYIENDMHVRLIMEVSEKVKDIEENINGKFGNLHNRNKSANTKSNDSIVNPVPSTSKSYDQSTSYLENRTSTSKDKYKELSILLNDNGEKGMSASKNKNVQNNAHSERLRRLDLVSQRLKKYQALSNVGLPLENVMKEEFEKIPIKKCRKNQLSIFVLDISNVSSDECFATWLQNDKQILSKRAPEETILYSLVAGKGELIMFGGIQRDADNCTINFRNPSEQVSNTLHFIRAPKYVI